MRIAENGEAVDLVGQPDGADEQQTVTAVGVEGGKRGQGGEGNGAGEDARHQQRSYRQKADPQQSALGAGGGRLHGPVPLKNPVFCGARTARRLWAGSYAIRTAMRSSNIVSVTSMPAPRQSPVTPPSRYFQ